MKRCLMLVEGPYDQLRLSLLVGLFDESKLSIVPFESDAMAIPSFSEEWKPWVSRTLRKDKRYNVGMFDEIVYVADLDGCYVDDSFLAKSDDVSHVKYHRDKIECVSIEDISLLHQKKKCNIDSMLLSGEIAVFYNSTNIDDAFDEKQNPSKRMKRSLALETFAKYRGKPKEFLEFLHSLNRSREYGYMESWDYIKQGVNSLSSSSNIIVFVMQHMEDLTEENRLFLEELIGKR